MNSAEIDILPGPDPDRRQRRKTLQNRFTKPRFDLDRFSVPMQPRRADSSVDRAPAIGNFADNPDQRRPDPLRPAAADHQFHPAIPAEQ